MSRSAWKYFKLNLEDIEYYLYEYKLLIKNKGRQSAGLVKNNLIINTLNYMHKYIFHQGSTYVKRRFYKYNLRSTGYAFLKFRKPFWFRSKKKK